MGLIALLAMTGAGGEVVTIQGELVPRDDIPTQNARRTSKFYSDILGRNIKTDVLDWDGNVSLTRVNELNGRDQILSSTETDIASSKTQVKTYTYDGFGRLKSEHLPEMDSGLSRTYDYNLDGSIKNKWDARDAKTSYSYNNQGLLTQIDYLPPQNSNLPSAPTITYGYNNVGKRLWMEDGIGRVDYEYDDLSRLTSETRTYDSLLTDAPQSTNGFRFDYTYHTNGDLKKVTYPNGITVDNNLDQRGRTESVTGSIEGQAKTFLSNVDYSSWGSPKKIDFGNGTVLERTFNDRLLPDTEKFTGEYFIPGPTTETRTLIDNEYQYYDDGRLKMVKDHATPNVLSFDRLIKYDQGGRIVTERTGKQAHGTAQTGDFIKYKHDITYDAFGNYKTYNSRSGFSHNANPMPTSNYNFVNNRLIDGEVTYNGEWYANILPRDYDADGRMLDDGKLESTYNDAGYIHHRKSGANDDQYFWQDGDGTLAKVEDVATSTETINGQSVTETETVTRYHLRSSLLGEAMIFETSVKGTDPNNQQTATKDLTYIYGLGKRVAIYKSWVSYYGDPANPDIYLDFEFDTSFGQNHVRTYGENSGTSSNSGTAGINYFNSLGLDLKSISPGSAGRSAGVRWDTTGFDSFSGGECTLDGVFEFCSNATRLVGYEGNGGAVQCPNNDCGPQAREVYINDEPTGTYVLARGFQAHADGSTGRWVDTFWAAPDGTFAKNGDILHGNQITEFVEDAPSDCATLTTEFVDFVKWADLAEAVLQTTDGNKTKLKLGLPPTTIEPKTTSVLAWAILAYAFLLSKAIPDTHNYRTTGFKDILTKNGQKGQVYQHVVAHAAGIIAGDTHAAPFGFPVRGGPIGETGNQMSNRAMRLDQQEAKTGKGDGDGFSVNHKKEALTEIQDDIAGRKVGNIIRDYRKHYPSNLTRYNTLYKDIFNVLCDY